MTILKATAEWVAKQPNVRTVQTLIDQGQTARERVAVNAGLVLADTTTKSDPLPGETVQLRYAMDRPSPTESP